ncbi:hypothetical protein [Gudongella sp. SC589]|jgi:cytochrome c oxidase subunit 4|uniref:hypothetical protein n=1 Tax=Gudongella sp. SC589 TaxID=3385990 RepID=UPI003904D023
MISFLLLGSFVLGLIAWILPGVSIGRYKISHNKNGAFYSIVSISACAIAISFQVMYSNQIVQAGDWSALLDTSGTSTTLSIILLIVTLVLNGISLSLHYVKK